MRFLQMKEVRVLPTQRRLTASNPTLISNPTMLRCHMKSKTVCRIEDRIALLTFLVLLKGMPSLDVLAKNGRNSKFLTANFTAKSSIAVQFLVPVEHEFRAKRRLTNITNKVLRRVHIFKVALQRLPIKKDLNAVRMCALDGWLHSLMNPRHVDVEFLESFAVLLALLAGELLVCLVTVLRMTLQP